MTWLDKLFRSGGYEAVALTGDKTLDTDLALAAKVIRFTGTLDDSATIKFPAESGADWLVINDATKALTLTAGSGSTVEIASGTVRVVAVTDSGMVVADGGSGGLPVGGITDAHVSESAAIQGTKIAAGSMPTDRLGTQQQSHDVDCSGGGAIDGGQAALDARAIRLTGSPVSAYTFYSTATPSAGLCAWIIKNETAQTANLDLNADAVTDHALAAGESVLAVRSAAGVQYLPVAAGGTIPDGSIDPSTKLASGDFGSLDLVTTGFIGVGSGTRAASGIIRAPSSATLISSRGTSDMWDQAILSVASNAVIIGDTTNYFGMINARTTVFRVSSSAGTHLDATSTVVQIGNAVESSQVRFGASGGPFIRAGSGTPEGAVSAPVGSLYLRTDGGAGTSLYVKESGTGNTGWVAK